MSSGGSSTVAAPAPLSNAPAVRLKVEQASYAYAATDRSAPKFTLGPVSFEAQEREIVAILGPNASGKSTLLRLIAGLPNRFPAAWRSTAGKRTRSTHARAPNASPSCSRKALCLFPCACGNLFCRDAIPTAALRFESEEDRLLAGNALAQVGAEPCAIAGWTSFPAAKSSE